MKMKMKSYSCIFFMLLFAAFRRLQICLADCDNLQDTCPSEKQSSIFINGLPCNNPTNTVAHNFKTMELTKAGSSDNLGSSTNIVTASKFPGLNTLGLSIGRIDIEVDGIVNLHNHPRATEMIFVKEGVLEAGFLDTQNKVFQKGLMAGDVFVIPKGLFHFFLNRGLEVATVFSVFNSQNPGLGSLTFSTSSESVEKLKRRLISLSDLQLHSANDLSLAVSEIIYS